LLEALGFVGFAGLYRCAFGRWLGGHVAACIIIGPRLGRFEQGIRLPPGNKSSLIGFWGFFINLVWLVGFNGGKYVWR